MTKYYGGWIYADRDEIPELVGLGVFGPMEWSPDSGKITKALGKTGTISHCYCDWETLKKLEQRYHPLWVEKYPHYNEYPSIYPTDHFSEIKKGKGELWNQYLPDEAD